MDTLTMDRIAELHPEEFARMVYDGTSGFEYVGKDVELVCAMLQAGRKLIEEKHGIAHPAMINLLLREGETLNSAKSIPIFEAAYKICQEHPQKCSDNMAFCAFELVLMHANLNHPNEALAWCLRVLEADKEHGTDEYFDGDPIGRLLQESHWPELDLSKALKLEAELGKRDGKELPPSTLNERRAYVLAERSREVVRA